MGRGASGTSAATIALAVIALSASGLAAGLAACGGHSGKPSSSTGARGSSTATPPPTASTGATSATSPPADAYWPYAKLVDSLAGRTLTLARGTVRLDPALLECNGEGSPVQSGPTRGWRRYTCTQTLFAGGVDQDVTFDVAIESGTELRIISPRYGSQ